MLKPQYPYPSNYWPDPREVRVMLILANSNSQVVRDELAKLFGEPERPSPWDCLPSSSALR